MNSRSHRSVFFTTIFFFYAFLSQVVYKDAADVLLHIILFILINIQSRVAFSFFIQIHLIRLVPRNKPMLPAQSCSYLQFHFDSHCIDITFIGIMSESGLTEEAEVAARRSPSPSAGRKQVAPRRSHPAQSGETFDGPPTLERSGSERRVGAVTSPVP